MKKYIAILIAVCMIAALFAGCTSTSNRETAEEKPTADTSATEEPKQTAATPEDPTEAPEPTPTSEPTPTPAPTPVPFTDPYAVEILDWVDGEGQNSSFDSIFINSTKVADGDVQLWKDENDETVDGTGGKVKTVSMRGWAGFFEYKMVQYGYQIDNSPVQWVKKPTEMTEEAVKAAGGDYAQRFNIKVPVTGVYGAGHEIKLVVRLEDETLVYLNNEAGPFMLFYDGPEAPETAIDGVIDAGEYNAQYSMKSSTVKTWTGSDIGETDIEYYVSLKKDGLYVGIDASGVASGDMLQLNFNPGARIDDSTGLFISFIVGDELKILQHNHKTTLKNEIADSGTEITDLIEAKIVAKDGGYVVEAKLPVDFFKVTDVDKAEDFVYGRENLYFGMFAVLGGSNGFTTQSEAPGTDWTCKALLLHEYTAY